MGDIKRIESAIKHKKKQIEMLRKEIGTLEDFKRLHYFSMMNGKGVY